MLAPTRCGISCFGRGCPKVPPRRCATENKDMRNIIWLTIGFALASSVVGCIYRLGYLHGEIAAMTESENLGGCISAKCTPRANGAVHGTAPTHGEVAR